MKDQDRSRTYEFFAEMAARRSQLVQIEDKRCTFGDYNETTTRDEESLKKSLVMCNKICVT